MRAVTFFIQQSFNNRLKPNKADIGTDTLYLMRYTFRMIIMKKEFFKKSTHAQKWERGLTSGLKSCGSAESIRNRGVTNGKNRF
jgi:hypothetical protein